MRAVERPEDAFAVVDRQRKGHRLSLEPAICKSSSGSVEGRPARPKRLAGTCGAGDVSFRPVRDTDRGKLLEGGKPAPHRIEPPDPKAISRRTRSK